MSRAKHDIELCSINTGLEMKILLNYARLCQLCQCLTGPRENRYSNFQLVYTVKK